MSRSQVDQARKYCFTCPVQSDCYVFAMKGDESFGIWGGFTPEERRRSRELTRSLSHAVTLLELGELLPLVVRL